MLGTFGVQILPLFESKPTVCRCRYPTSARVFLCGIVGCWVGLATVCIFVRPHLLSAIRFPPQHKKSTADLHTKKKQAANAPSRPGPYGVQHPPPPLESTHHTPGWPHSPPPHAPHVAFCSIFIFLNFYPTFLQDSNVVDVSITALAS